MLLVIGAAAVICLMTAMYFHDHKINNAIEIIFFGLAAALALIFEWLLHKK